MYQAKIDNIPAGAPFNAESPQHALAHAAKMYDAMIIPGELRDGAIDTHVLTTHGESVTVEPV